MSGGIVAELGGIAETIVRLARPGMKPRELIGAVRKEYPDVSKKDVGRAAFLAVILASENKSNHVRELHDLAIKTRNSHDETTIGHH